MMVRKIESSQFLWHVDLISVKVCFSLQIGILGCYTLRVHPASSVVCSSAPLPRSFYAESTLQTLFMNIKGWGSVVKALKSMIFVPAGSLD